MAPGYTSGTTSLIVSLGRRFCVSARNWVSHGEAAASSKGTKLVRKYTPSYRSPNFERASWSYPVGQYCLTLVRPARFSVFDSRVLPVTSMHVVTRSTCASLMRWTSASRLVAPKARLESLRTTSKPYFLKEFSAPVAQSRDWLAV